MHLQIRRVGELDLADLAFAQSLIVVQSGMRFQVAGTAESLETNGTFVGSFSGVDEIVFLQMGQLGETLSTEMTFERSLAGVGSLVDLQVRQLPEMLTADLTLVFRFVAPFR